MIIIYQKHINNKILYREIMQWYADIFFITTNTEYIKIREKYVMNLWDLQFWKFSTLESQIKDSSLNVMQLVTYLNLTSFDYMVQNWEGLFNCFP